MSSTKKKKKKRKHSLLFCPKWSVCVCVCCCCCRQSSRSMLRLMLTAECFDMHHITSCSFCTCTTANAIGAGARRLRRPASFKLRKARVQRRRKKRIELCWRQPVNMLQQQRDDGSHAQSTPNIPAADLDRLRFEGRASSLKHGQARWQKLQTFFWSTPVQGHCWLSNFSHRFLFIFSPHHIVHCGGKYYVL